MEVNELWSAVLSWAMARGAKNINEQPGVWHSKTMKDRGLGPLDVAINPHKEEIEGIPPFNVKIAMKDYFPGLIALVGPDGGIVLGSPKRGENERGLIEHFKTQTPQ